MPIDELVAELRGAEPNLLALVTAQRPSSRRNGQVIEVCAQCGFDTRFVSDVPVAMGSAFDALADSNSVLIWPRSGALPIA